MTRLNDDEGDVCNVGECGSKVKSNGRLLSIILHLLRLVVAVVVMPVIAACTAVVAAVLTRGQLVLVPVSLGMPGVHVVVVVVIVAVVHVAEQDRVLIAGRWRVAVMVVARWLVARCWLLLDHMGCCVLRHHRLQPCILSSLDLRLIAPHGGLACSNRVLLVVQLLLAAC